MRLRRTVPMMMRSRRFEGTETVADFVAQLCDPVGGWAAALVGPRSLAEHLPRLESTVGRGRV